MRDQVQEDGAIPPVFSLFPSAEGDNDQPTEEGPVDAHREPDGISGRVAKEEDLKDETGPALLPPTSPTPERRTVVPKGRTLMPTSPTFICLLRINPTPQRGRGSILTGMPLLLFLYVIFVARRVLCPDTYSTLNIQLARNRFAFTSSAQVLRVDPEEPEKSKDARPFFSPVDIVAINILISLSRDRHAP